MIRKLVANWSPGLLIFFFLLAFMASVGTYLVLDTMETTEAGLSLSFRRCVMHAPHGLRLTGFTPVSRCVLHNTETILLGPGRLIVERGPVFEAFDIALVQTKKHTTAHVMLSGQDMAAGNFLLAPGTLEARSLGAGELRLDVSLSMPGSVSRGELSLGDSCSISAVGYELRIAGEPVPALAQDSFKARFYSLGGAGKLFDGDEWGCHLSMVGHDLTFSEPTRLEWIKFLNAADQCADVHGGVIDIESKGTPVNIPANSCMRLDAEELFLRQLGMRWDATEIVAELNGSFRSLTLNGVRLIQRSTLAVVAVGLGFLLAYVTVALFVKSKVSGADG